MADIQEGERQLERSPSRDSLFDDDLEKPASSPSQLPSWLSKRDASSSDTAATKPDRAPPCLRDDPASGLAWVKNGLLLSPTWTVEPTAKSIITTLEMAIGSNNEYRVRFLRKGTLSKLYDVSFSNQGFIMRVSLPVCPQIKTEAEVATLDWVNEHTALPVPCVRAYDSSRNNPLGFEWILMNKLVGKPLSECWSSVSFGAKKSLVGQIAAFAASTFTQPFHDGIGSIFKAACSSGDHRGHNSFSNVSDWMIARLEFASSGLTSRLNHSVDQDERTTLERMLELTRRIEKLMLKFMAVFETLHETMLRATGKDALQTILYHDALSLDNILINDDGFFCGVIDWQCVSCLPLYEACQFPAFLQQGYDRSTEPVGRFYLVSKDDPPHPAYFQDYRRWEITQLRQFYIKEMTRYAPGYVEIWRDKASADLRDYEAAIQNCDNEFAIEPVQQWVGVMEDGGDPGQMPKRLHELLAG
ncbi:phosphotransferase enzyme family-domain-containing protein [Nemania sp. FL0916]|nr:phosphotransferase enzyme family-domain-containing protein [Nemania sp. FL0916]